MTAKEIGALGMFTGLLVMVLGIWWQVECDAGRWRCCIPIWLSCEARIR